ncbi:MAG TPA: protein kinase, partial [Sandaracinaceae bacterium]
MGIPSKRAPDSPELRGTERFEVRRRLGSGSFGVVCEGWDRERNSPVAIKWLSYVDAETIHRFKNEFRSLAEISHPNLVQLYDLESDGDRWFFTMELVDGVTLPEHLRPEALPSARGHAADSAVHARRRPLPASGTFVRVDPHGRVPLDVDPREIRAVFAQLAQGVCALHEAGKLHRDLKCQNVMVTPAGRVVLLDFGLVREVDPARVAEDGDVAGTPVYMAPEQCAGAPIGPAADWYAVGVMLFRALTDRLPFDGNGIEVMSAKQQRDAPRASELVHGVPPDLDELCARLLARRPDARPTGPEILRILGVTSTRTVTYPPRPAEVFVGRHAQLQALLAERRAVRESGPRAVYVHGKSGLGKTALVTHALARAQAEGALVFEGRCFERETLPYKALDSVVDSLATYLRRLDATEAARLVPDRVADLVRVFPALGRVPAFARAAFPPSEVPDPQEQRRLAIEGFGDLLRRLARDRELIVFIDDLQWGDRDSATVVARLLEMQDVPVLWIGTYRSDEAAWSAYLEYLRSTAVHDGARRIEVGELEEQEAIALLEARLGHRDPAVIQALAREAAGSPLFIDLLVRRAQGEASARTERVELSDVIRERLDALAPEARTLASALAICGRPLEPAVAAEVVGTPALDVTALTQMRNARLLRVREREDGEALELYHDRIRETVAAGLAPSEERELHARLARALARRGADPERLANHYRGAGELEHALRYTLEAARRADQSLAFGRAAELYAIALQLVAQLGPRALDGSIDAAALRVARADALRNAGRGAEAARTYLSAAAEVPRDRALRLRRLAGEQFLLSGHVDEGLAVARTILRELGMSMPESTLFVLGEFFVRRAQLRARGLRFVENGRRPHDDELELVDLLWAMAGGLAMIDPVRGGLFQSRQLLMALDLGDVGRVARAVLMEIPFTAVAGVPNRRRTAELERLGEELAARVADDYTTGLLHETRGGAAWLEGRWLDALE